jgi:hypothetical protein
MKFKDFSFGTVTIDTVHAHDVMIDRGKAPEAKKETIQAVSRRL